MKDKNIIENSGTQLARWIAANTKERLVRWIVANTNDMNTSISAEKFDGAYLTEDEK